MKPVLGWTMLSREEMRQAERSLANGEQDTRDEIGFLLIHQGFADRFFPGTSVLHSQAQVMQQVLAQWDESAYAGLQSVTQSEVAVLAEFALSGPGVVLGRALFALTEDASAMEISVPCWMPVGTGCAPT